jgi:hypothetical protein
MAILTLDASIVGNILGDAGAINVLTAVTAPRDTGPPIASFDPTGVPTSGYLALVDAPAGARPRVLVAFESSNPALPPGTTINLTNTPIVYSRLIARQCRTARATC